MAKPRFRILKDKKIRILLISKHALNRQILTLQHLWIARNNAFNCLLSFLIEKHKVQRNYITKLLEKAGVTEKK